MVLRDVHVWFLRETERLSSVVARAVKCDVTKDEQVAALVRAAEEYIAEAPDRRRLWGLVNNAGVGISGPFEWLSVQEFQQSINVNFMGTVRCCKGFLPLLKRCRGSRIVNITSVVKLHLHFCCYFVIGE